MRFKMYWTYLLLLLVACVDCRSGICRRRRYQCTTDTLETTCLHVKKLCNGRVDCANGSDEDIETCRAFCGTQANRVFCEFSHKCQKPEVPCNDVCGYKQYKCDGESAPYGCISMKLLCDGETNCPNADDEQPGVCEDYCNNTLGRYYCRQRQKCLGLTQMCDGKRDCDHCLDEDPEHCRAVDCTGRYTRCGENSYQCIKLRHICDNRTHCLNGWDEEQTRCHDITIVESVAPAPSSLCYPDDNQLQSDEYATCSEDIQYYDYTLSNYFPDVVPVRQMFDQGLCERALFIHNWVRSFHVDMPLMTYEPSLAASAEDHAMYLGDRLAFGEFGGHTDLPVGENIFFGYADLLADLRYVFPMEDVVFTWYDEGRTCNYNFETGEGDGDCEVGHFRQIVYQYQTKVGCGASITTYFGQEFLFVVCQYLNMQTPSNVMPLRDDVSFPTTYAVYEQYEL